MLKSALINKEYSYENMNILELKKKIIEQEQLTETDILCMYNEIGYQSNMSYPLAYVLNEEEKTMFNEIVNETFLNSVDKFEEIYQLAEAETYKDLFSLYDEFCKENNCENIPIMTFLVPWETKKTSTNETYFDFYNIIKKKYEPLYAKITSYLYNYRVTSFYETLCQDYFIEEVNKKLSESVYSKFFIANERSRGKELPCVFDIKKHKNGEYQFNNNVQTIYSFSNDLEYTLKKELARITKKDVVRTSSSFFGGISLCYSLSKEEYDKIILEGFWNTIEKLEGELDFMRYNQEIESMPITINIDTKTNKIQLIDGFKRVLFVRNNELLNQDVAIKVFKDLDDKDFFSLLYAANYWKIGRLKFHDRGFLFSIFQRFNIVYSDFSLEKKYSLISLLEIYDNIKLEHISMGENTVSYTLNSTYRYSNYKMSHAFFVRDLVQLKNLGTFVEENQPYQPLICEFFFLHFLQFLGYVRRLPNAQKDIDILNLMKEVLYGTEMKKLYKKKTFSSGTYVCNSLRDNGIDKLILSKIKNACLVETN